MHSLVLVCLLACVQAVTIPWNGTETVTSLTSTSSDLSTSSVSVAEADDVRPFMLSFSPLSVMASCSGASQLQKDVTFGYWKGTKTDLNKQHALKAINLFKSWLKDGSSDRESFKYSSGSIVGYMWVGAMVQNSGFAASDAMDVIYDEINNNGIPNMLYIEYVDEDPMKTFGITLNTGGGSKLGDAQRAVKLWSEGKPYNTYTGKKTYNSKSLCYLDYGDRKKILNDKEAGECNYVLVKAGEPVSETAGVNGESLQGYNPDLDFSALQVGQPVCISVGTAPDIDLGKSCSSLSKDLYFGYWKGTKTDQNQKDALKALELFQSWLKDGSTDRESFKYSSGNIVGYMWVGAMIKNTAFADGDAIQILHDEIADNGIPNMLYIEYVDEDPMKTFGITLNTGGGSKLGDVQRAVKHWSEGKAYGTNNGHKDYDDQLVCYLSYGDRKKILNDKEAGECEYFLVKQGENVATTAGVNGESLQGYNPNVDFSALTAGQPLCKSVGVLPNNKPSENDDGSCYSYTVQSGDTCTSIANKYTPLTVDELNSYNSKTYQWYGCSDLLAKQKICLSSGKPPRPTPNPDAQCGPLAPGDLYNSECPLNACCSDDGFCGTSSEYCEVKDSATGAPGTKGCYSNCYYGHVHTDTRSDFANLVYWLDEDGDLEYDPSSLVNDYDMIHYAFVPINSDFSIDDSKLSTSKFLDLQGVKKIVSFGGSAFSQNQDTYQIFRDLVQEDNRQTFTTNVINLVKKYNLDGVDLDWEYPGAQDIPGIPADDPNNGENYYELAKLIKSNLPSGKTLSMAIPASYYYLQNYPVDKIQDYLDYFVFMTYDFYGTWDLSSDPHMYCHTNKTDVIEAIKMADKAGIQMSKIYSGLANYGRSYQVKSTSCIQPGCEFIGPGEAGSDLKTPGILSTVGLAEIIGSTKDKRWSDNTAMCDMMTYDGDNWVGWAKQDQIDAMRDFYHHSGLKGSALWAANYY